MPFRNNPATSQAVSLCLRPSACLKTRSSPSGLWSGFLADVASKHERPPWPAPAPHGTQRPSHFGQACSPCYLASVRGPTTSRSTLGKGIPGQQSGIPGSTWWGWSPTPPQREVLRKLRRQERQSLRSTEEGFLSSSSPSRELVA